MVRMSESAKFHGEEWSGFADANCHFFNGLRGVLLWLIAAKTDSAQRKSERFTHAEAVNMAWAVSKAAIHRAEPNAYLLISFSHRGQRGEQYIDAPTGDI